MRYLTILAAVLLVLVIVATGCRAPAAPSAPTGALPATTAPQKPPAAPATAAWQKRWDDTLTAAKKEGDLLIYLNGPSAARTAIADAFFNAFGIRINFVMGSGAEIATKMTSEYRGGIHQVDALLAGTISALSPKAEGFLSPITPMLILPEVTDPSVWVGGKLPFYDKAGFIVGYLSQRAPPITYNTEMVKKDQITSYLDLLKPEWKGKMAMFDPTISGMGNSAMGRLAVEWGDARAKEYLTDLLTQQQSVMTRDMGQHVDWLAKGKYPVDVFAQTPALSQYLSAGAPIADARIKEKVGLSASNGGLAIPTKPANPNAIIIFLNWFLSKQGQIVAVQSMGFASSRVDVPATGVNPMFVLKPGEPFIPQDEEFSPVLDRLTPQLKEILAKAGY